MVRLAKEGIYNYGHEEVDEHLEHQKIEHDEEWN